MFSSSKTSSLSKLTGRWRGNLPLAAVLLFTLLLALWFQWPALSDDTVYQDDFRKLHWMHRYNDPELFQSDPLASSSVFELNVGSNTILIDSWRPGYSIIFFLGGKWASPLLINKLLIFPLLLFLSLYAYRIGDELGGPKIGVAVAISVVLFNLSSRSSVNVAAGLPRSFTPPAILAITYYLMKTRPWKASAAFLLGGIVYFPITLLGATVTGLYAVRWRQDSRLLSVDRNAILPLILALAIVAVIVTPSGERLRNLADTIDNIVLEQTEDVEEPLEETTDVVQDDSNGEGRPRIRLFTSAPFIGQGGLATKPYGMWSMTVLALLAATTLVLLPSRQIVSHRMLRLLIMASLICFVGAWVAYWLTSSFVFYYPSRYTRVSIALALIIFVVVNAPATVQETVRVVRSQPRLSIALFLIMFIGVWISAKVVSADNAAGSYSGVRDEFQAWILAIAFVLFIGSICGRWLRRRGTDDRDVSTRGKALLGYIAIIAIGLLLVTLYAELIHEPVEPSEAELHQYIETLPKDVVIGGHLCALNSVPMMAKRQVIQSCEHLGSSFSNIAMADLRSYYAESLQQVEDFCASEGVDYYVVRPDDYQVFRTNNAPVFFEPYNSIILQEIGARRAFALENIPEQAIVFRTTEYVVLRCQDLT